MAPRGRPRQSHLPPLSRASAPAPPAAPAARPRLSRPPVTSQAQEALPPAPPPAPPSVCPSRPGVDVARRARLASPWVRHPTQRDLCVRCPHTHYGSDARAEQFEATVALDSSAQRLTRTCLIALQQSVVSSASTGSLTSLDSPEKGVPAPTEDNSSRAFSSQRVWDGRTDGGGDVS
ncbi:uncharacterized protein LOC134782965 [Penaeus indicus]|uniref:uncharacterized protein LOC134782965 n=1 Tax=Penaeus indicus TaxID=29960 RepID=UPI00300D04A1